MSITVSRVSYVESRNMFETQASKISLYLGDKRNKLRVCKSFLVDYFTVHITGICSTKINVEILNTKRQQHNRHTHTHTHSYTNISGPVNLTTRVVTMTTRVVTTTTHIVTMTTRVVTMTTRGCYCSC